MASQKVPVETASDGFEAALYDAQALRVPCRKPAASLQSFQGLLSVSWLQLLFPSHQLQVSFHILGRCLSLVWAELTSPPQHHILYDYLSNVQLV